MTVRKTINKAASAAIAAFILAGCMQIPAQAANCDDPAITTVKAENLTGAAQVNQPITFGHVFAKGDIPANHLVEAKLADNSVIPLQNDVKTRYEDGSIKHVILSGVIPSIAAGEVKTLSLGMYNVTEPTSTSKVASFSAKHAPKVVITLNGVQYTADPAAKLQSGSYKQWLSGSIVNEYLVNVPLTDANGVAHPHLNVRYAIRANSTVDAGRFDITVENNWAYEPNPSNLTYDVAVYLDGQKAYEKLGVTHYHHSRWHKVFSVGLADKANIKFDLPYMIKTGAIPNYDRSVVITQANIDSWKSQYAKANVDIMGLGLVFPYMPNVGGRPDIGILPGWTATYLLTQDKDMKGMVLNSGDEAGSFSMHYRDKNTDRPLRLIDWPWAGWGGNLGDSKNPATGKYERFTDCVNSCSSPYTFETAHVPSLSFVPYMITGDYYYLEEMEFYMMASAYHMNPWYRGTPPSDGLFVNNQIRQQAWELRGYAEGAFLIPDNDTLKSEATRILSKNLEWYNAQYANNPAANKLSIFVHSYAFNEEDKRMYKDWQGDFFTAAIGRAVELGFTDAVPMLKWKAKGPVDRMIAPGFCWITATPYYFQVRDGVTSDYPIYDSWAKVYQQSQPDNVRATTCGSAEMAVALGMPKAGMMIGNDATNSGYPANMQAALAYAVNSGIPGATDAWNKFISRPVVMPYSSGPQFAIVPR